MTTRKGYSIGVRELDFKKFVEINKNRPQDKTRADTFAHMMYVFEEQKFREKAMKL